VRSNRAGVYLSPRAATGAAGGGDAGVLVRHQLHERDASRPHRLRTAGSRSLGRLDSVGTGELSLGGSQPQPNRSSTLVAGRLRSRRRHGCRDAECPRRCCAFGSVRTIGPMNSLTHAVRRLRHSPGFAIFAVVTLALSIGVTTAMYSLVRTGLRPDVEAPSAARLVLITDDSLARTPRPARLSWLDYQSVAALSHFDGVVAWSSTIASVSVNGRADFGVAEAVSENYFDVIGLKVMRGRALDASDDEPGAPAVAVISAAAWRTRLQSDPAVIGRSIKVNGHELQIVGVLPGDFHGLEPPRGFARPEIWLPLSSSSMVSQRYARQDRARRDHAWLSTAGRLAQASTVEVAGRQLQQLSAGLDASEPLPALRFAGGATTPQSRHWQARAVNQPIDFTEEKSIFRIVLLLPTLVLLVACSNLANFALSRGFARRNELAVRQALGASRWQLVRGFVVEYGLLSVAGAGGGLVVA